MAAADVAGGYMPSRNIKQLISGVALRVDGKLPRIIVIGYQFSIGLCFSTAYAANLFRLNDGNRRRTTGTRDIQLISPLFLILRKRIDLNVQQIFAVGVLNEFASLDPRRKVVERQAVGREIAIKGKGPFCPLCRDFKPTVGAHYRQIGIGDIHIDVERGV